MSIRVGYVACAAVCLMGLPAAMGSDSDIVLNEFNYNPGSGDERDEFVEIFNRGPTPVDLSGWSFVEGISFTFLGGTFIGPEEYLAVSPDVVRAKARGIENVVGNYFGRLDNGGENVAIANAAGVVVDRVHYGDGGAWPDHPDGLGPTLELARPDDHNDLSHNWASSLVQGGTPGRRNSRATAPPLDLAERKRTVVLNEVRPPDSPGAANGFIEIFNRTDGDIPVGGWWIADSRSADYRYHIPAGTVAHTGERLVFWQAALGFDPSFEARYALLEADGMAWVDGINPRMGLPGTSFGRWPDGDEDMFIMESPTPADENTVTLETRVAVNEILYHPTFVAPSGTCTRQCSDPDQWIELYNRGGVDLSIDGWTLSKAVEFRFPGTAMIRAGDYVVVAADRPRFLAAHPGFDTSKVFGSWTGSLSRSSEAINLNDERGNRVDHVEYGDGQPWNDVLEVSPYGAGDGIDDRTLAASEWTNEADDGVLGRTLELVSPAIDNRAGSAWAAGPSGGTPLAQNSTLDATPPPAVWDVAFEPVVPRSTDPVIITCRVSSSEVLVEVEALWHLDPGGAVTSLELRDDGLSGDRFAGDGIFGGTIPPQASKAIVAFQVRALADDEQSTTVPRPPAVAPYDGFEGPYFLYQHDDSVPPSNARDSFRILVTDADLEAMRAWFDTSNRPKLLTNKFFHGTFIARDKAYHHVGVRFRGESSRYWNPPPYRIDFASERRFRGLERLNLINPTRQNELFAANLFDRAAIPYMQVWAINLYAPAASPDTSQGVLNTLYLVKENVDGDFLDRYYGGSSGGNLYRAMDPEPVGGDPQGNLTYFGEVTDPTALASYKAAYDKKSNAEEADWSDVAELCAAFNTTQTPNDQFVARMNELIDTRQWARFFAVESCISNRDGGIWNSSGEDYLLYRVPANSSRDDAGKWVIIPWDIDEIFNSSTEALFLPSVAGISRFLRHPTFAPLYYEAIEDLRTGAFSRAEVRKELSLIAATVSQTAADTIETFVIARDNFYETNVQRALTAGISNPDLVKLGDLWRYFKGQAEPAGGDTTWTNLTGFDDSGWPAGATGIGYGGYTGLVTYLNDMQNNYTTVYTRRKFTVPIPSDINSLSLWIDYDDGFVAFLNGTEVARGNMGTAGTFVPYTSTTPGNVYHNPGTPETFDITAWKDLLVAGDNVLAIQMVNGLKSSGDLVMLPRLIDNTVVSCGCGTLLFTTGSPVILAGRANAGLTRSVKVNGAPATYDGYTVRWTATVSLGPGSNAVRVEAHDAIGMVVETLDLEVVLLPGGFTQVSGTLSGNTTWTAEGGPYVLTGNVTVPAGVRLGIEPGAAVFGQGGTSIVVRGLLEALGTAEEPILFRSFACENRMTGILLDSTGVAAESPTHRLAFCDFQNVFLTSTTDNLGTVAVVGSKVLIEDCVFRDLSDEAIRATAGSRVEVRRSLFERTREGVRAGSSTAIVIDSTFSAPLNGAAPIWIASPAAGERSRVERSIVEGGGPGNGIRLVTASADINDSIVRGFEDRAVSIEGAGSDGPSTVSGTIVHTSWTGISVSDGGRLSSEHATVVGCREGLSLRERTSGSGGGQGTFDSGIFWSSLVLATVDAKSSAAFTYSDLESAWPGAGNIALDPRFNDPYRGDVTLSPYSPCIATARDGGDMGAIPYTGNRVLFIRGDVDQDLDVGMTDAVDSLDYLFGSFPPPSCMERLDANDDASIDVSDPVYLLFHLYAGGSPPPAPFPNPGVDPIPGGLPCL